jgi:general secretion pathway protein H
MIEVTPSAHGPRVRPSEHEKRSSGTPARARRSSSVRWRRHGGFTLVEVLVVVALMAILSAMVVGGSGMLSGTRMRSAGALIMSSVRMGVTRANSIGRPVRLVFDLENDTVTLEETRGRMLRVTGHTEGAKAGAQAATEVEQQAAEYAREIVQGPRAPEAAFTPSPAFVSGSDDASAGRELGRDIRFVQVQTEHDVEPLTEGRAYLYFWPGGGTERASIQITRPGDHTGLTVLVSALTGRAKLARGRVELEEARRDGDLQEREE